MLRRLVPILALALVGGTLAHAQTAPVSSSELMLSWRSNGSAPAGYSGRVAASGDGTVLVTAEALVAGRPADLSRYEVRWYVNDELYDSGFGLQAISVRIDRYHQDSFDVRVEIIGAPFSTTLGTLSVPLTDPWTVIEPRTGRGVHQGKNLFTAAAYSFNVTNLNDLVYEWTVNGLAPSASEDPQELVLSFDGQPNEVTEIALTISHPQNSTESASASFSAQPAAAVAP